MTVQSGGEPAADAAISQMMGLGGDEGQEPEGAENELGENGEVVENDFTSLPDWAQQKIRDLRREAAAARTKAKATPVAAAAGDGTQDVAAQVAAAKAEARAEAKLEMAAVSARSAVEAALTGIVPDPAALAEDLDMARYITDEGELDRDEIAVLKAKYQTLTGRKGRQVGHGRTGTGRSSGGTAQEQFAESMQGLLG